MRKLVNSCSAAKGLPVARAWTRAPRVAMGAAGGALIGAISAMWAEALRSARPA